MDLLVWLALGVAVVAFLYSAVGHAGASGYIAVMSLLGLAPAEIRMAALVLNILVATIAAAQFALAGHFSRWLFWPAWVTWRSRACWDWRLRGLAFSWTSNSERRFPGLRAECWC